MREGVVMRLIEAFHEQIVHPMMQNKIMQRFLTLGEGKFQAGKIACTGIGDKIKTGTARHTTKKGEKKRSARTFLIF